MSLLYSFPTELHTFEEILHAMQTNQVYKEFYLTFYSWGSTNKTRGIIIRNKAVHRLDLSKIKHVFMDSTFLVCPNPFLQITTLLGIYEGSTIILGACFMIRRTTSAYAKFLDAIKEEFPELRPEIVMSDYESAMMKATKHVFPDSTHKCCRFHFSQAIYRKLSGELNYLSD